jgi:hypothetical protein
VLELCTHGTFGQDYPYDIVFVDLRGIMFVGEEVYVISEEVYVISEEVYVCWRSICMLKLSVCSASCSVMETFQSLKRRVAQLALKGRLNILLQDVAHRKRQRREATLLATIDTTALISSSSQDTCALNDITTTPHEDAEASSDEDVHWDRGWKDDDFILKCFHACFAQPQYYDLYLAHASICGKRYFQSQDYEWWGGDWYRIALVGMRVAQTNPHPTNPKPLLLHGLNSVDWLPLILAKTHMVCSWHEDRCAGGAAAIWTGHYRVAEKYATPHLLSGIDDPAHYQIMLELSSSHTSNHRGGGYVFQCKFPQFVEIKAVLFRRAPRASDPRYDLVKSPCTPDMAPPQIRDID